MTEEITPIITIVGFRQAKKGFLFLHEGPLRECEDCTLFKVCMMNLEPKRVYKVVEVREKDFSCKYFEEGAKVVKVVEADLMVAIERKYVFPQGIVPYKPQECYETDCENYLVCTPQGLKEGDKGKILEVIGQIRCPLERLLVLVVFRRLAEHT